MPKRSERAFTDAYLRSLKAPEERTDQYDATMRGLGLRVAPTGTKTWFVMKRVHGKNKRKTFGRYPAISLQDARAKALQLMASMANSEPRMTQAERTFGDAMEEWFTREQNGKRSAGEKRRALNKDVLPAWGKRPLNSITRADVRALLDSVSDRGAPVHANRLLAALRRFFNWAVERDLIYASPAAGIKPPAKEISRERTLTRDELAAIWKATGEMDYPFGPYIRLLILTGQRRNEVAGARWKEFNLADGTWTIPGERAKNGKAHLVHLSQEAIATLNGITRDEGRELVFTTTGTTPVSGFSRAKKALDDASGISNWRIHDLRRTFATIATGELGIEPQVVDKILNHSTGAVAGVAAVYQRAQYLDKRKDAMERWASFVDRLTS
jgi:integrase